MGKFLLCIDDAKGEPRFYIVKPGADCTDLSRGTYEPCWVDATTGAIISGDPDWVVSIADIEERLSS